MFSVSVNPLNNIIKYFALGLLWLAVPVLGQSSGSIEGNITILEKNFWGNSVEKTDREGVLIYVTGFKRAPSKQTVSLLQKNKTFLPKVLPIVVGQSVSFPNEDSIYHNVFSVSPIKSFDLGQYKKGQTPKSVQFDQAGLVPVYCNIHPHMIAYIAVLENDAFALTDKDGYYKIDNVPAANITINAWVDGANRVSKTIQLSEKQNVAVNLTLEQAQKIKPHKRKDNTPYPETSEPVY